MITFQSALRETKIKNGDSDTSDTVETALHNARVMHLHGEIDKFPFAGEITF